MRFTMRTAILTAMCAAGAPAFADVWTDCTTSRDATLRLKACADVIADTGFTNEQHAGAYRNRGQLRLNAGATAQAIADYSAALKLSPTDVAALLGRAQAHLTNTATDAAIDDYSAALQLTAGKPSSASALVGRGHALLVKGSTDAALADFDEAIKINPKSATAFNNRGLARKAKGDVAKAIDDYTSAITLNPVYALAYNNRGYAYEALGKREEAAADFGRALLLDRSLVGASAGLKRLNATGPLATESDTLVQAGRALVEANCSRCHAIGDTGASPNPKAPEFRALALKHPVLALREPLSRGIAAQHDEMPKFALNDTDIDRIVAYINNLPVKRRD